MDHAAEKGFPIQPAWRGEHREPDPLILDDQALIAHVAGRGLVGTTRVPVQLRLVRQTIMEEQARPFAAYVPAC